MLIKKAVLYICSVTKDKYLINLFNSSGSIQEKVYRGLVAQSAVSALQALVQRSILTAVTFFCGKIIFCLFLIQEELVVSNWGKSGLLLLLNASRFA